MFIHFYHNKKEYISKNNECKSPKHAILNQVFKHDLSFRDGAFRTPSINPQFEYKVFDAQRKRVALF
jgi:hypothetical protein